MEHKKFQELNLSNNFLFAAAQLRPGEGFDKLHRSFVIFICTFDPFGYGRYTYTVEERCLEEDFALGDETRKIFLNTKGSDHDTDREIVQFLKYVEDSTSECAEGADSAFVKRLHERVLAIKHDREMEERYMVLEEMLANEKRAGLEMGIKQGTRAGEQVVLQLTAKMCADGKQEDIPRLSEDHEFFEAMLKKYQIK